MKCKPKLCSHNSFSLNRITIVHQRNFFKNILKELDERKERGEQDFLKYIRGISNTISKNSQTSQEDKTSTIKTYGT